MGERVKPVNRFQCVFPAKSVNESFARTVVSSFVSQLDPRMDELSDLKTAVSVRPSFVCVKYMPFPFPFCFVCRLRLLYNRRCGVFCRKLRLPFSDFGYLQLFTTARFCAILTYGSESLSEGRRSRI